ncbi:MAG: nucleoside phosphorylase [Elusimicrobiota bacterium]|jgi:uridine phosphorylase
MKRQPIPLLDFDPTREAIIEPHKVIKHRDVPPLCVLCFFREVIDGARKRLSLTELPPLKSEMGKVPVYKGTFGGHVLGVIPAAVGASLAAGLFEEVIARGGRKFVVCGGAGVLDRSIASGDIIIPTSAVRDEGTSYHYLPPLAEARPSPKVVRAMLRVLKRHKCPFLKGKTWTTDAFYRETRAKVARRRSQGCLTVEMEAAALFAVAAFRKVKIGQFLYGGDDVSGLKWDPRHFGMRISARERLFWLSVEACVELDAPLRRRR